MGSGDRVQEELSFPKTQPRASVPQVPTAYWSRVPGLAEPTEKRELEELGTSMARLPSRAGPGLVCYAAVVQRLGAVLSNGAAPIRPGRWHSVRPPHGTPGATILARMEAAPSSVEHAQKRRKRKRWIVG